jgi:hypothetical protein
MQNQNNACKTQIQTQVTIVVYLHSLIRDFRVAFPRLWQHSGTGDKNAEITLGPYRGLRVKAFREVVSEADIARALKENAKDYSLVSARYHLAVRCLVHSQASHHKGGRRLSHQGTTLDVLRTCIDAADEA